MLRDPVWLVLPALLVGCATGGGQASQPLTWPPGQYLLEATVTYDAVETYTERGARRYSDTRRDTHSADLYIEPDGSMRLDSHTGICQDPTPSQLQEDTRRRVRSFRCGDLMFVLRPGPGTVTGGVQARVRIEIRGRRCLSFTPTAGAGTVCAAYEEMGGSRLDTEDARLRVTEGR